MKNKWTKILLFTLVIAGFGILLWRSNDTRVLRSRYEMSPEAFVYLNKALDIIQTNFYKSEDINWTEVRSLAYNVARNAIIPRDTYPAIKVAIDQLDEGHTVFWEPGQFEQYLATDTDRLATGYLIEPELAYINLPGTMAQDVDQTQDYAVQVQMVIRQLDEGEICGWIIDLRSETGGNMWGILAGIGPVLGNGKAGAFVDPDGTQTPWFYESGLAKIGETVVVDTGSESYELRHPNSPVAVLTGPMTTSAGEAIVVSFHGREKTRFFGESTHGFPSSNTIFYLQDQAALMITAAVDADRTGQTYDGPIIPDEIIDPADGEDALLNSATSWLLSQTECQ